METPTTLREEVRQTLAASTAPMTRAEIFKKCNRAGDEQGLSVVLSQLCACGDIKNAGKRETLGERAQTLYSRKVLASSGGGAMKAKKKPGPKPAKRKARGPDKKRARAAKNGSARLQKVQRRNADSPAALDFRCGLYSDGSMDLDRAGEIFQLSEPEVRALFAYIEKVMPA